MDVDHQQWCRWWSRIENSFFSEFREYEIIFATTTPSRKSTHTCFSQQIAYVEKRRERENFKFFSIRLSLSKSVVNGRLIINKRSYTTVQKNLKTPSSRMRLFAWGADPQKVLLSCSLSATLILTWSHVFSSKSVRQTFRIHDKKQTKRKEKKNREERCRKCLSPRIHASVDPTRRDRARNIKVSNYNARHDTSFRSSSIKSHETAGGGGHRYRVICARW